MENTTAEPGYLAPIDVTAEAGCLVAIDDTAEPEYDATSNDTGARECAALTDDVAQNSTYHETVQDMSESTHTDVSEVSWLLINLITNASTSQKTYVLYYITIIRYCTIENNNSKTLNGSTKKKTGGIPS